MWLRSVNEQRFESMAIRDTNADTNGSLIMGAVVQDV